jgi:hypothetical protein
VANILPISAAAGLFVLHRRGRISFVPEAGRVVPSLVALGAGLALLLALTWVLMPALFPALRAAREFAARQRGLLLRGSPLMIPVRLVLFLVGHASALVLWANLAVVAALALLDVAAILVAFAVFVAEVVRAGG